MVLRETGLTQFRPDRYTLSEMVSLDGLLYFTNQF